MNRIPITVAAALLLAPLSLRSLMKPLALLLLCSTAACGPALASLATLHATERKPNFLFLYTDDHRWDAMGVVQHEQGDYAYLLHIVRSLKSTGKGACILPHGVLFRGNPPSSLSNVARGPGRTE
jgi:hypothetical protein